MNKQAKKRKEIFKSACQSGLVHDRGYMPPYNCSPGIGATRKQHHLKFIAYYTVIYDRIKICAILPQLVKFFTAQHSPAQHSTAQHSTAQHSTAQHSTAQHSTAQHSILDATQNSTTLRSVNTMHGTKPEYPQGRAAMLKWQTELDHSNMGAAVKREETSK